MPTAQRCERAELSSVEKIGRIFPNPSWHEGDVIEDQPEYGWYHGPLTDRPYMQRNYPLFGMLDRIPGSGVEVGLDGRGHRVLSQGLRDDLKEGDARWPRRG